MTDAGGHAFYVNDVALVSLGQELTAPSDPAYSAWADSQWGWGWRRNPTRARHVARANEVHDALPFANQRVVPRRTHGSKN